MAVAKGAEQSARAKSMELGAGSAEQREGEEQMADG